VLGGVGCRNMSVCVGRCWYVLEGVDMCSDLLECLGRYCYLFEGVAMCAQLLSKKGLKIVYF